MAIYKFPRAELKASVVKLRHEHRLFTVWTTALLWMLSHAVIAAPETPAPPYHPVIYVVRAADTSNKAIKEGVKASLAQLDAMLDRMRIAAALSVQVIDVKDDQFSCTQILSKIQSLNPNEDDVVLFYYLGHGLKDAGSDIFPEFDCIHTTVGAGALADTENSSLTLNAVVQSLHNKPHKPRMIIAVADSCNRYLKSDISVAAATAAAAGPTPWAAGLNHLFLDYKGTIILGAAAPYENAIYYTSGDASILGGVFTSQFLSKIAGEIDSVGGTASWASIVADATKPIELPPSAPTNGVCTAGTVVYKCQHPIDSYELQLTASAWPH